MRQITARSAAGKDGAYALWYCLRVVRVLCRRAGVYRHHILSCSSLLYDTSSPGAQNEAWLRHMASAVLFLPELSFKNPPKGCMEWKLLIVTSNNDERASNSVPQDPMTSILLRYCTLKMKHSDATTSAYQNRACSRHVVVEPRSKKTQLHIFSALDSKKHSKDALSEM